MRTTMLASLLMLLGGAFLVFNDGNILPKPSGGDLLSEFYEQNRISTVLILEDFTDEDKDIKKPADMEWLVTNLKEKAEEDREEVDRYIGRQIALGNIETIVEELKTYNLGSTKEDTDE